MYLSLGILVCMVAPTGAKVYKIGLLCPMQDEYEFSCYSGASAASIAIEKIQSDPALNANGQIELSLLVRDSGCQSKMAGGQMIDLIYNHTIDVVIGPPCSNAARSSAELTSFFNIPQISWIATNTEFSNKELYSTFARVLAPFSKMGEFLVNIYDQYKWHVVSMVTSERLFWHDASKAIQKVFEGSNITVSFLSSYKGSPTRLYMQNTMRKVKQKSRVVVLIIPAEDRRQMMLEAYHLGMCDGDYVFYTIDALPEENLKPSQTLWKRNDGQDNNARKAFNAVFQVSLTSQSNVNLFRLEVARRMRTEQWAKLLPLSKKAQSVTLGDRFTPFLHDAIILYALSLNKTMNKGQDTSDGSKVYSNMKNVFFEGMSGNVLLDEKGDREPEFSLQDMDDLDGSFVTIAELKNLKNGTRVFKKDYRKPSWANGMYGHEHAPTDVPSCGFSNELCPKQKIKAWVYIVMVVSGVCIVFGVLVTVYFFYRRSMFEKRMMIQSWRILFEEIEGLKEKVTSGFSKSDLLSNSSKSSTTVTSSRQQIPLNPSSMAGSVHNCKSVSSHHTAQLTQIFTDIGFYKGLMVSLKYIKKEHIQLTKTMILEFNELKQILHENLNVFVGACIDAPNICAIWLYCPKGSIQDVIMNDAIRLDNVFKHSFMADIANGMSYLHKSKIHSHGYLKSSNCLVDAKWGVKITDYGIPSLIVGQNLADETVDQVNMRKLWTAPEHLRENFPPPKGSQKGDVYSFAIICFEIIMRTEPYTFDVMSCRDVVSRVRNGETIPFRPMLPPDHEIGRPLLSLVRKCWEENPEDRLSFSKIRTELRKITNGAIDIMENVLQMMEKYASNLEDIVEERTSEVIEEKKKTDQLLYKMLPPSVAESLKVGDFVQPQSYQCASLYFSDIVGFTAIASDSSPMQIVDFLNDLYSCFDEIIATHDVYKVETIGDAYMCVSGVPVCNGNRHAIEIADCALDILSAVATFKIRHRPQTQLRIRIGLHSGSVVAGVVGLTMPRYCLFGDNVNFCSHMESTSKPMKIHMSSVFHSYLNLDDNQTYQIIPRGEISIPGKGLVKTVWLVGKKGYEKPLPKFEKASPTTINL